MTFQPIMRNRFGTEERVATQIQLDVLPEVLNDSMDDKIKKSDLDLEWLRRCEERQTVRPFPHNVAVESTAARIEDLVYLCPYGVVDADEPSGIFLGIWITDVWSKNPGLQEVLYRIIRDYMDDDKHEFHNFDMGMSLEDQWTFLLLVAHAYFFENENRRWEEQR